MHVDRAGAAEVVVAPHLAQQLLAREDAARVRGEEPQQLELLEREIERAAVHLRRVARLVDDDARGADHRRLGADRLAADDEPEPGIHLGGPRGVEDDVVDAPLRVDRCETALREDDDEGGAGSRRREDLAQRLRGGQIGARVDDDGVGGGRSDESGRLSGNLANPVAEQTERGENVGVHLRGQDEQLRHVSSTVSPPVYKRPTMGS